MATCLLALGSNLGDRKQHLRNAVQQLSGHAAMEPVAVSRFRETEPAGGPGRQDPFLNAAMLIRTSLDPQQLLSATQTIEACSGRTRDVHWGARSLDIDLLLYDDLVCRTQRLVLPHPWMVARRFVVEPAAEIAPQMVHPELGWTMSRLQRHLTETPHRLAVEGIVGLHLGPRILQQVSADFIADPTGPVTLPRSAILDGSQQLELVERRCQRLQASSWCQRDVRAISEFWFAESAVVARGTLPRAELDRFEQRLAELIAALPPPKLLMLCATSESMAMRQPPDAGAHLGEYVRRQNQYPWVELPVATDEQRIDQITAALQSMQ